MSGKARGRAVVGTDGPAGGAGPVVVEDAARARDAFAAPEATVTSRAGAPRRALLDVNVLIALLDAGHIHHALSTDWLAGQLERGGWASCPITLNGCIRILSQPAYPGGAVPPGEVALRLREACAHPAHRFWPDTLDPAAEGALDWRAILGSRQVTDAYLLALAVQHDGCLVTLDRAVPLAAVPGATPERLVRLGS